MTGNIKRNTLLLLGLVMMITMVIAASLPQLELQPGLPLPRMENDQVLIPTIEAKPVKAISVNKFIAVYVLLLLAAGLILYVIYNLLKGAEWKNLAAFIWPLLLVGLMIGGFALLIMMLKIESSPVVEVVVPTFEPPDSAPLGSAPPWLLWLVGIGLLVTGSFIGVWIFGSRARPTTTIDIVGLEAEKAWRELKTGLRLKDVIIKCYRQMSLAVGKEQGIEREDFMTTREFENLLEGAGLPRDPIHQLTQLFEAVRYGNWQPNPIDEQKAIHCLEAILLYSREMKETTLK